MNISIDEQTLKHYKGDWRGFTWQEDEKTYIVRNISPRDDFEWICSMYSDQVVRTHTRSVSELKVALLDKLMKGIEHD